MWLRWCGRLWLAAGLVLLLVGCPMLHLQRQQKVELYQKAVQRWKEVVAQEELLRMFLNQTFAVSLVRTEEKGSNMAAAQVLLQLDTSEEQIHTKYLFPEERLSYPSLRLVLPSSSLLVDPSSLLWHSGKRASFTLSSSASPSPSPSAKQQRNGEEQNEEREYKWDLSLMEAVEDDQVLNDHRPHWFVAWLQTWIQPPSELYSIRSASSSTSSRIQMQQRDEEEEEEEEKLLDMVPPTLFQEVVAFDRVDDDMDDLHMECLKYGGVYQPFLRQCKLYWQLEELCIKLRKDSIIINNNDTRQHILVPDEAGGGAGCQPNVFFEWSPAQYRRILEKDLYTYDKEHSLPRQQLLWSQLRVTLRHSDDPFLAAWRITDGSFHFGYHTTEMWGYAVAWLAITTAPSFLLERLISAATKNPKPKVEDKTKLRKKKKIK
ncbi:hypothetical protein QOT17_017644 [Balamuthia mandrillaris]